MKKTTLTAALALTLTAALMTGCTAAAMGNSNESGVAPAGSPSSNVSAGIAGSAGSEAYIPQADAENAALADAGLAADGVTALRSRLEYDDGRAIYDVEFWTDTDEYDYDIDAVTGDILSKDRDAETSRPNTPAQGQATPAPAASATPAPAGQDATASSSQVSGEYITEDAARQAALNHAGVADGDAQFVRTHLDRDDGRTVYDVEFWSGSTEYDYEIDAVSGEVLSFDFDAEYCQPQSQGQTSGSPITADDAKRIAFEYAGVSEADAQRVKVDPDQDNDRPVYDIEWEIGPMEYDVTVDMMTGSVVSFESGT